MSFSIPRYLSTYHSSRRLLIACPTTFANWVHSWSALKQMQFPLPDCAHLQDISSRQDINATWMLWASTWGMRFNAKKCYAMNIFTRTRNHRTHNYSQNSHILPTVTRVKYLGITISNDLNWSTHINTITNKSNSKLGFLRRNLRRCAQTLKATCYLSLIRPTIDYAASVCESD